jgi:hypothetical protein
MTSVTAPTSAAVTATSAAAAAKWATASATAATATGASALTTSTRSWLGSERVVLHVVIADLNALAAPGVNVVLPSLRTRGVYQLHQRLGGRHQLGVYPGGGQLRGERLLPSFGSCLMLSEDELGIRPARKTSLHFGLEALVSVLDCRRCRVLDSCSSACCEGHLD